MSATLGNVVKSTEEDTTGIKQVLAKVAKCTLQIMHVTTSTVLNVQCIHHRHPAAVCIIP